MLKPTNEQWNLSNPVYNIKCPDNRYGTLFGCCIRKNNDYLAISARHAAPSEPIGPGVVYLYKNYEIKVIESPTPSLGDRFGISMALGKKYIIIGSYRDNKNNGAVFIYDLNGSLIVKIKPGSHYFGYNLDYNDEYLIVGCYEQNKVFIYDKDLNQKIIHGEGRFGRSVKIFNDFFLVGATWQNAIHKYDFTGKLISSYYSEHMGYGSSIFKNSNNLVVGAYDSNRVVINEKIVQGGRMFGGSVYGNKEVVVVGSAQSNSAGIYDYKGNQISYYKSNDEYYGYSVFANDQEIYVGAPMAAKVFVYKNGG